MEKETDVIYKNICKGDLKAFESFYKKYQPRLFVLGIGIVNDEDVLKDLVQETFLSFWDNKEQLNSCYSVSSYLLKIFYNKCRRYLRRKSLLRNFSDLSELKLKEIEMSYYSVDDIKEGEPVLMSNVEEIYVKTIENLPKQCREVFLLNKEEGMTSREIAERFGISIRTVENHIYKAIKAMRYAMKDCVTVPFFLIVFNLNTL